MNIKITRPLVRYHGGKFRLANWIISHFPDHRIYTEAFGGGGSVLLKKPRSYAEIYNDLDSEIVDLFEVARDFGEELKEKITLTPFSRREFLMSYIPTHEKIEQARRTVVRSFMGFGSSSANGAASGFRANSNRSGTTPAHDWANLPKAMDSIIERLKGVVIENKDAKEIIKQHDSGQTLHYVDPPYLSASRSGHASCKYKFEMSDEDHEDLAIFLSSLKGAVVLSGYDNIIYDKILVGWQKQQKEAFADGAKKRIETLWIKL